MTKLPSLGLSLLFAMASSGALSASTIITYGFNTGAGAVDPSFSSVVSAGYYILPNLGQDGSSNTITGFSNANDNVYMRATGTLTSSLPSSGTAAIHTFSMSVNGLGVNEVLDLTDISFQYRTTGSTANTAFFISFFSNAVGLDDLNDRLGNQTLTTATTLDTVVDVDLTSSNTIAGSTFTGLTNGTTLEFYIYFGDDGTQENSTSAIQRIGGPTQGLIISGDIRAVPEPQTYALMMTGIVGGLCLLRRRRNT